MQHDPRSQTGRGRVVSLLSCVRDKKTNRAPQRVAEERTNHIYVLCARRLGARWGMLHTAAAFFCSRRTRLSLRVKRHEMSICKYDLHVDLSSCRGHRIDPGLAPGISPYLLYIPPYLPISRAAQERQRAYLPYIPISPLYLPHVSPISRSRTVRWRASLVERESETIAPRKRGVN